MATEKAIAKRAHLKGRQKIQGRRLRYEGGSDICLATLAILKEFVADCDSPYFVAVQDEVLPWARALIERGDAIERDEYDEEGDLPAWSAWLRDVAVIVPYLWD